MNTVNESPGRIFYRCIQCHSDLGFQEDNNLACGVCEAIYPSIESVKVLVSDPTRFLRSTLKNLSENRKEVTEHKARLASVIDERSSQEALSLANEGYDGQLANLELIERVMMPVKKYLSGRPEQKSLFDDFHLDESLWSSLNMLSYFYRDWNQLEEARFLTNLFTNAIEQYCGSNRESAVVLGCGACGLVYDLAEIFPIVFGVDLAIEFLLLAKGLIDGNELDLHFNFPNNQIPISQKLVRLKGPIQKRGGIELIAANANNLPFASSSVSCVISSYLLDIAHCPNRIISEIHRVLAPKGLWINFSILSTKSSPLNVRTFDQLNNLDLPSFFRRSGFILLSSAMRRFKNVDLSTVSEWAGTSIQTPVFSVSEKHPSQDSEQPDYFAEYFAQKAESIWLMIPKISEYVALTQESIFTGHGIEERQRIAVYNTSNSRPITKQNAIVAKWLLRNIDGTHTIREIFDMLRKEYGDVVGAGKLIRFFSDLQKSDLIEFNGDAKVRDDTDQRND